MIVIEPPGSDGTGSASLFASLRRAELGRFLSRARKAAGLHGDVTVLLASDARLKDLNRTFRRKNKPTDVLSFPAAPNAEGVAGDLAVSVETAARQAAEHGHALEDELRILLLHGVLHLAGFDHETDAGEMRSRESQLRAKLKLPVGLIERVHGNRTHAPRKLASPTSPGNAKAGSADLEAAAKRPSKNTAAKTGRRAVKRASKKSSTSAKKALR